jgi:hypothetical protein
MSEEKIKAIVLIYLTGKILVRPVRFELTAFCSGGKQFRAVSLLFAIQNGRKLAPDPLLDHPVLLVTVLHGSNPWLR